MNILDLKTESCVSRTRLDSPVPAPLFISLAREVHVAKDFVKSEKDDYRQS